MADYYLVELARGPEWDDSQARREQAGWEEHAAFMDVLTEEDVVVLGGPVGEGDGDYVLLVFDLASEAAVRTRLADDPWLDRILAIQSVKPWSVWVRGSALTRQCPPASMEGDDLHHHGGEAGAARQHRRGGR